MTLNETTSSEPASVHTTPRVVVGVDGSDASKQALRWAAQIAHGYRAHLLVVTAWHFPVDSGWSTVPGDWNPRHDMEKCMTQAVDEVFGSDRPADLTLSVVEGNSARALIDASAGATMVVVGSRGHGGFAGLLLGSVSASVAEHALCPVLVVHGDQVPPEVTS
jgi:nucleotide-binding universal stress UspA family protein